MWANEQGQASDRGTDQCGGDPDGERPPELRDIQVWGRREIRYYQRECSVSGQALQPEEDERPDPSPE
jgi:hypothetical protein